MARTKLKHSSAYHPQTDGQSDAVNKCVETYLHCFEGNKPKLWHKWLASAEYSYNTNYHASIKTTPFKALHGRGPPTLFRGEIHSTVEVQVLMEECNQVIDELKQQSEKAENLQKLYVGLKYKHVPVEVGRKLI